MPCVLVLSAAIRLIMNTAASVDLLVLGDFVETRLTLVSFALSCGRAVDHHLTYFRDCLGRV